MPYTAGDVLVRAIMTNVNGLAADQFINDFAFRRGAGAPSNAQLEDVMGHVGDFYRVTQANALEVGLFIGTQVDRSATHELAAYQIQAGPLGSPLHTIPWLGPVTPTGVKNMPNEVAGVVSFHGTLTGILEESGATRPRARRRGRVYIGPLRDNVFAAGDVNPPLEPAFLTTLRQAIIKMADDAAADGWTFSVWSRANAELYEVVGGWTDDAPDTQRRRGQKSTARVTYTV